MSYQSLRSPVALFLQLLCLTAMLMPARLVATDLTGPTSKLVDAIGRGDVAAARTAIEARADINADVGEGRTPLITAVMFARPGIVRLLLERGADPRKQADDPRVGNAVTAAFTAMNGVELTWRADEPDAQRREAAVEVLRLVAARKADLNLLMRRATSHYTPLMLAAEAGALDAVEILLAAGADPNVANGGKYTALDFAVDDPPIWSQAPRGDRVAVVRALLKAGARTDRKGADGLTPAQRAARAGSPEIRKLLAGG